MKVQGYESTRARRYKGTKVVTGYKGTRERRYKGRVKGLEYRGPHAIGQVIPIRGRVTFDFSIIRRCDSKCWFAAFIRGTDSYIPPSDCWSFFLLQVGGQILFNYSITRRCHMNGWYVFLKRIQFWRTNGAPWRRNLVVSMLRSSCISPAVSALISCRSGEVVYWKSY